MKKFNKNIFVIVLLIIVFLLIVLLQSLYFTDKKEIKDILSLNLLPNSLTNEECESWALTDIIDSCYFDVDPVDFNYLTTGRNFTKGEMLGSSIDNCGGYFGTKFIVADSFIVFPQEFKHGGNIIMVADKDHHQVCLQRYIE